MGVRGFSGIQSILYHNNAPTSVRSAKLIGSFPLEYVQGINLEHRHLKTDQFSSSGDAINSKVWLLGNAQVRIGLQTPTENMTYFFRHADCDEMLFCHWGKGTLKTQFGNMPFVKGDYIILPVGTLYQVEIEEPTKFLCLESNSPIEFPKRYRNEYGQLLEHSPFCERDIRVPTQLTPKDEKGEFTVKVKSQDQLNEFILDHHPFDVVGWDGYLYPFIFNIKDFEPITGRIHLPPPTHQTFNAEGFVVCSFVPRMYDYHPQAVSVPYNHSNVNSDEVLYYVEGDFMSRKGINTGSFTHHPAGIPHGPHPGTVEASLGKTKTEELAVMIDTHHPLQITKQGFALCDKGYIKSWI